MCREGVVYSKSVGTGDGGHRVGESRTRDNRRRHSGHGKNTEFSWVGNGLSDEALVAERRWHISGRHRSDYVYMLVLKTAHVQAHKSEPTKAYPWELLLQEKYPKDMSRVIQ